MRVTGERVTRSDAGWNPTWQRHVAAYASCTRFLGPGLVLDLGCGVGHSYSLLSPRPTIGMDLDPGSLRGQRRPTAAADMRLLPAAAGSVAAVVAVQSIEHVLHADRVLAEVRRVLRPDGVAVLVTPNRLTFARPDEVIDPYHFVEYDRADLFALCQRHFSHTEIWGLFGSERYLELHDAERLRLDRLLRLDPMRLRRRVPRAIRQRLYDWALGRARQRPDARATAITVEDFELRLGDLEDCLDLVAACRR